MKSSTKFSSEADWTSRKCEVDPTSRAFSFCARCNLFLGSHHGMNVFSKLMCWKVNPPNVLMEVWVLKMTPME